MAKKATDKKAKNAYQNVLKALSQATGLEWNAPPASPSLLKNGYYAETEMVRAPHLVRQLKAVATEATGRPRAIVFERSSPKNASVNIPKEVAENEDFLEAIAELSFQASRAVSDERSLSRPAPKRAAMPHLPQSALHSQPQAQA